MLELLKNLALGRVLQFFQAAFRRKMGRQYRALLRQAVAELAAALATIRASSVLGAAEVAALDAALHAYHERLGRFGPIFADFEPREYEQVKALKRAMAERVALMERAQALLRAQPPPLVQALP